MWSKAAVGPGMEPATSAKTLLDGQGREGQLSAMVTASFSGLSANRTGSSVPLSPHRWKDLGERHSQASSLTSFQFSWCISCISIFSGFRAVWALPPLPPSFFPRRYSIAWCSSFFFLPGTTECSLPSNCTVLDSPHCPSPPPHYSSWHDPTCLGQKWTYVGFYEFRTLDGRWAWHFL